MTTESRRRRHAQNAHAIVSFAHAMIDTIGTIETPRVRARARSGCGCGLERECGCGGGECYTGLLVPLLPSFM